ncbi:hypothetical protein SASPL_109449 [Salvia splendens]|uniref:UBC core domain-containing protein n=1 Tax=Salvia splendens TaxID=180675 RepID=A0A8X8YE91_SALSN|nr:hypothetical protein SASPL_109449 [Salvia splendens]
MLKRRHASSVMAEDKYNRKNPAVKRILQEVKEMQSNPSEDFVSLPLEENIFEWQFAIRGPRDSEFEGGIYHGRIQLPSEYPFKPPSFLLLTPNGRFETQTKICLSISIITLSTGNRPGVVVKARLLKASSDCSLASLCCAIRFEPGYLDAQLFRTALVALIAFMPTSPNGALGSLDYPKEERRALATKSRESAPRFGSPQRQKLIDEIHEYMLSKAQSLPQSNVNSEAQQIDSGEIQQIPQDIVEETTEAPSHPSEENGIVEEPNETPSEANVAQSSRPVPTAPTTSEQVLHKPENRVHKPADDRLFTLAAFGLTIAIISLLLKMFLKANGHGAVFMDES